MCMSCLSGFWPGNNSSLDKLASSPAFAGLAIPETYSLVAFSAVVSPAWDGNWNVQRGRERDQLNSNKKVKPTFWAPGVTSQVCCSSRWSHVNVLVEIWDRPQLDHKSEPPRFSEGRLSFKSWSWKRTWILDEIHPRPFTWGWSQAWVVWSPLVL